MNKKKLQHHSFWRNFFLFMRIIRLYLTGSPYGAKTKLLLKYFSRTILFSANSSGVP